MNELIEQIAAKASSRDPRAIAEHFGVAVETGSWHPVTYGEFDRGSRRIVLNSRSPIDQERVLAHELGHFFLGADASESECELFAGSLLKR